MPISLKKRLNASEKIKLPDTMKRDHQSRKSLLLMLLLIAASVATAGEKASDPSRVIQYRGPMPWLEDKYRGAEATLKFELYRSPEGGAPFWKETRTVKVNPEGWVQVDLGTTVALPDEAFQTPFRFLAIWQNGIEFAPRKQVASLAYVAAPLDDQILPKYSGAATQAGSSEQLGKVAQVDGVSLEIHPRAATNWLSAVQIASKAGTRLPTFDEWYRAYDNDKNRQLQSMAGHYEWVIPWVYEPAIHGRLHELYRGKPVACYYEELSPLNAYPFRLVGTPSKNEAPK